MEVALTYKLFLKYWNDFTLHIFCAILRKVLSKTDDRGCKCRKAAGEESPGFTGQDAG